MTKIKRERDGEVAMEPMLRNEITVEPMLRNKITSKCYVMK